MKRSAFIALFFLSCFSFWQLWLNHTHHESTCDFNTSINSTEEGSPSVEEDCLSCDFIVPVLSLQNVAPVHHPFTPSSSVNVDRECSLGKNLPNLSRNKSPPVI